MKPAARYFIVAAVLAAFVIATYRTTSQSPVEMRNEIREPVTRTKLSSGHESTDSVMAASSAKVPAPKSEIDCDLDAPNPEIDEAQEERNTAEQARYDLLLARRLRETGRPIDQAVGSMLGRVIDWDSRELADQVDAAARASVLTSDPALYGSALKACARLQDPYSTVPAPDACTQLSLSRLTLLEPDNVFVWLNEAQTVRKRKDNATELGAIYQASVARRIERPATEAQRVLLSAMQSTDPAWLRYGALRKLSDQIVPSYGWGLLHEATLLSGVCETAVLDDPNRRELCEGLAHNLLDRSVSAAGLWTGIRIRGELGWSDDRLRPYYRKVWPMFVAGKWQADRSPNSCRN